MPEPLKQRSLYPAVFLAAILYVVIANFPTLSPILLTIILILLISLAINPLITKLRRLFGGRTLATGIVVLLFFIIAALTGWGCDQPGRSHSRGILRRRPFGDHRDFGRPNQNGQ